MSINPTPSFPGALPNLRTDYVTEPASATPEPAGGADPSRPAGAMDKTNAEVNALAAKVGIEGSTDTDSHEHRIVALETEAFGAVFTANGSVVVPLDRSGTIVAAEIYVSDGSGSGAVAIGYLTAAQFAANASPTVLGTISLSSAKVHRDVVLAGWTKTVAKGDKLVLTLSGLLSGDTLTAFVEVGP